MSIYAPDIILFVPRIYTSIGRAECGCIHGRAGESGLAVFIQGSVEYRFALTERGGGSKSSQAFASGIDAT